MDQEEVCNKVKIWRIVCKLNFRCIDLPTINKEYYWQCNVLMFKEYISWLNPIVSEFVHVRIIQSCWTIDFIKCLQVHMLLQIVKNQTRLTPILLTHPVLIVKLSTNRFWKEVIIMSLSSINNLNLSIYNIFISLISILNPALYYTSHLLKIELLHFLTKWKYLNFNLIV